MTTLQDLVPAVGAGSFGQQYGQRVGLVAVRTARAPHVQRGPTAQQLGQNGLPQILELFWIAEKSRHVDGQVILELTTCRRIIP